MTSNLGSDLIKRDTTLGFQAIQDTAESFQHEYERMKDKVMDEVKRFFRPEFLNRIDASVVFHGLTKEHLLSIVDLMLNDVRTQVLEKGLDLEVTKGAKELLAEYGFDPSFGARPLRRTIQNKIEDQLSEDILAGRFSPGETVVVDRDGEDLVIRGSVLPVPG